MLISIAICIWNGDVGIPNRRYTMSRVQTREKLRNVRDSCDGAGDGGVGVDTVQTVGEDDGKPG